MIESIHDWVCQNFQGTSHAREYRRNLDSIRAREGLRFQETTNGPVCPQNRATNPGWERRNFPDTTHGPECLPNQESIRD